MAIGAHQITICDLFFIWMINLPGRHRVRIMAGGTGKQPFRNLLIMYALLHGMHGIAHHNAVAALTNLIANGF